MGREYFECWFDEDEEIIETDGKFYYVVFGKSLAEIKKKVRNAMFRSMIDEGLGEEEGYWYRPTKLVNVNRNCDGSWTAVFELEMVE